jgi:hypothetical protein
MDLAESLGVIGAPWYGAVGAGGVGMEHRNVPRGTSCCWNRSSVRGMVLAEFAFEACGADSDG